MSRPVSLRSVLWGAAQWGLVLSIPFCALFAETHMQLRVFQNDYRTTQLTNEIQLLRTQIKELRAREADLEAIRRLEAIAPRLGLVRPNHDQIVVVDVPLEKQRVSPVVAYAQVMQADSGGCNAAAPGLKPDSGP